MSTNNIISNPTTNGRCGPQYGNQTCINNACCSIHGWCGGDKTAQDKGVWCTTAHGFTGKYDAPVITQTQTPTQTPTQTSTQTPTQTQVNYPQSGIIYIISSLFSCCLIVIILIALYFLL